MQSWSESIGTTFQREYRGKNANDDGDIREGRKTMERKRTPQESKRARQLVREIRQRMKELSKLAKIERNNNEGGKDLTPELVQLQRSLDDCFQSMPNPEHYPMLPGG